MGYNYLSKTGQNRLVTHHLKGLSLKLSENHKITPLDQWFKDALFNATCSVPCYTASGLAIETCLQLKVTSLLAYLTPCLLHGILVS